MATSFQNSVARLFKHPELTQPQADRIFLAVRRFRETSPRLYDAFCSYCARNGNEERVHKALDKAKKDGLDVHDGWSSHVALAKIFHGEVDAGLAMLAQLRKNPDYLPLVMDAYSLAITGLGKTQSELKRCEELVNELQQRGVANGSVFAALMRSYIYSGQKKKVEQFFQKMKHEGTKIDEQVYEVLLGMFLREKKMEKCLHVVKEMRDSGQALTGRIYNMLMRGFGAIGSTDKCVALYESMKRDGVTPRTIHYNTLIGIFTKRGDTKKAMDILQTMKREGVTPDAITYSMLIRAFRDVKDTDMVNELMAEKSGSLLEARNVAFKKVKVKKKNKQ